MLKNEASSLLVKLIAQFSDHLSGILQENAKKMECLIRWKWKIRFRLQSVNQGSKQWVHPINRWSNMPVRKRLGINEKCSFWFKPTKEPWIKGLWRRRKSKIEKMIHKVLSSVHYLNNSLQSNEANESGLDGLSSNAFLLLTVTIEFEIKREHCEDDCKE